MISYKNAVVSVMDGAIVDLEKLAVTALYGKLMLKAGMKIDEALASQSLDSFLTSESGDYIRAEPFVLGRDGRIIPTGKLWVNVAKTSSIKYNEAARMFYVELLPATIDVRQDKVVEFK